MKTLALSTASRSLAEYASELDDEVVLLTKRNRPFAAIVPLRNVDRESLALSTHPGFLALIERYDDGQTYAELALQSDQLVLLHNRGEALRIVA